MMEANNRKDWFEERKAFYQTSIKKPAELLLEVVGDGLTRKTGEQMRGKLFRIHRDVRFSKDKTPYKAHLHLMWRPETEGAPAWFFGASPSYVILGMGLMALQGEALSRYRELVDNQGDALDKAMLSARAAVSASVSDWGPEPLKRVPRPYAADHPQADLLRRKAFAVTASLPSFWRQDGVVHGIMSVVDGLLPLWEVLDAEFG